MTEDYTPDEAAEARQYLRRGSDLPSFEATMRALKTKVVTECDDPLLAPVLIVMRDDQRIATIVLRNTEIEYLVEVAVRSMAPFAADGVMVCMDSCKEPDDAREGQLVTMQISRRVAIGYVDEYRLDGSTTLWADEDDPRGFSGGLVHYVQAALNDRERYAEVAEIAREARDDETPVSDEIFRTYGDIATAEALRKTLGVEVLLVPTSAKTAEVIARNMLESEMPSPVEFGTFMEGVIDKALQENALSQEDARELRAELSALVERHEES